MSFNYGPCFICGRDIRIKVNWEGPHYVHDSDCSHPAHPELEFYEDSDYLEERNVESSPQGEIALKELYCECELHPAHADCCPTCIDIGYNINDRYRDEKEDSN